MDMAPAVLEEHDVGLCFHPRHIGDVSDLRSYGDEGNKTMRHFSFPACRRIARYFNIPYIPKYHADDILTIRFVEELARKVYPTCNDLTGKTERLAMLLFWEYYNHGLLALEIFVCSMVPQDVPPEVPAVTVPIVKTDAPKVCKQGDEGECCRDCFLTDCDIRKFYPSVRPTSEKKTLDNVG